MTEIAQDSAPWPLAGLYETQAIIDPRETRTYLKQVLRVHSRRPMNGVGVHRLNCWPTSY
jgi:hypothetical protein